VSGQTCAFGGLLGESLSTADTIMIADTCGLSRPHELRMAHAGMVEARPLPRPCVSQPRPNDGPRERAVCRLRC